MRQNEGRPAKKILPEDLGGTAGVRPLPLGLVVVTSYRPGVRWRPRPLSPGRAALELFAHTISARRDPKRAFATLRSATAEPMVLKGARGEAEEVAEALLRRLAEHAGRGW